MASNALKGITVVINGDVSNLASALTETNNQSRKLGTELASVERALKFNPDSMELLEQKEMYASNKAKVLEARLSAVRQGLEKVGQGSDAFYRLQRESITTKSKLEAMRAKADDASRALAQLRQNGESAADGLKTAESAADGLSDALRSVSDGAGYAIGEDLLDAAKGAAAAALETAQAWDTADARISAATGSAKGYAVEMSSALRGLYSDGWGESVEGLTETAIKAREVLGELDEQDLSTVITSVETMESVFGSDVTESLRGVNVLMEKFGLTATQACDLMMSGMQRGLDYTDELGDNLSEYAGRWAEAGLSATEYFSMLQAGVDAGAYNLDKVGDYLNEFLTSLSDGRMADSIDNFSGQTQAVWESYQAGGATAKDVLDAVVGELRDCESQTEALTLASDTWSSLGEDNALGVITALADVQDSYTDTAGAAADAAQALEESSAQTIESFKRKALSVVEPLAADAVGGLTEVLSAAEPAAEAFGDLTGSQKAAVTAAVAMAAAYPKVSAAVGQARAATQGLTTAQKASTAAAKASTVAWSAAKVTLAGVATLIAGLAVSALAEWAADAKEAAERSEKLAQAAQGVTAALSGVSSDGIAGVAMSAREFAESVSALRDDIADTVEQTLGVYDQLASDNFSMEAKNSEVERLAQEIEELSAKSSLTTDEQGRLAQAVREFNDATGAGIEVVNASTGELSMNAQAIDDVTEAYKNQARVKGYQDALSDLYAQQADALQQVQQAQDGLAEAEGRLAQAQEDLKAAENDPYVTMAPGLLGDYQQAVGDAASAVAASTEALDDAAASYMGVSESIGTYEDALGAQVEIQEDASDAAGDAAASADALTGAEEGAARAVTALADASEASLAGLRGSAETVEEAVSMLSALPDTATDAAQAVEDAFRGAMGDGKTVAELTDEVNSALKDAGAITDDLTEREVLLGYATGKTGAEMVEYARAIQEAKDAQEEQKKAAEEAREEAEKFRESVADLVDDTPHLSEALVRVGLDAASFAGMLEAAGVTVEGFKATYDALGDVDNPLQAIEQETGVYTWQMRDNLQTNMDAANQWADGMAELYSRVGNDNELAFAQYVESMGSDNLEFLNYLLYDADVSFSELAELYAQGGQTQADAALRVQKAAIDAMIAAGDAYYDEAGQVVDTAGNIIVDASGEVAGQATDALSQGLEEGSGQAAGSASVLGDATMDALMALPSEMEARGEAAGGYLGVGLGSPAAQALMAEGVAALSSAAADALIDLSEEMRDRGEYAGGMFALGMAGATATGDGLSAAVAESLASFAENMYLAAQAGGESFADGLLGGSEAASSNGRALADAVLEGAGRGESGMARLGKAAGRAYAEKVSSATSVAAAGARALLQAAYGGVSEGMSGMSARGQAAGGSYARGILYGYTTAYSNAKALAAGAVEAMRAYESTAFAAGQSLGNSFASGLSSATSSAVTAARAKVSSAVLDLSNLGRM